MGASHTVGLALGRDRRGFVCAAPRAGGCPRAPGMGDWRSSDLSPRRVRAPCLCDPPFPGAAGSAVGLCDLARCLSGDGPGRGLCGGHGRPGAPPAGPATVGADFPPPGPPVPALGWAALCRGAGPLPVHPGAGPASGRQRRVPDRRPAAGRSPSAGLSPVYPAGQGLCADPSREHALAAQRDGRGDRGADPGCRRSHGAPALGTSRQQRLTRRRCVGRDRRRRCAGPLDHLLGAKHDDQHPHAEHAVHRPVPGRPGPFPLLSGRLSRERARDHCPGSLLWPGYRPHCLARFFCAGLWRRHPVARSGLDQARAPLAAHHRRLWPALSRAPVHCRARHHRRALWHQRAGERRAGARPHAGPGFRRRHVCLFATGPAVVGTHAGDRQHPALSVRPAAAPHRPGGVPVAGAQEGPHRVPAGRRPGDHGLYRRHLSRPPIGRVPYARLPAHRPLDRRRRRPGGHPGTAQGQRPRFLRRVGRANRTLQSPSDLQSAPQFPNSPIPQFPPRRHPPPAHPDPGPRPPAQLPRPARRPLDARLCRIGPARRAARGAHPVQLALVHAIALPATGRGTAHRRAGHVPLSARGNCHAAGLAAAHRTRAAHLGPALDRDQFLPHLRRPTLSF